ncbi:MAG TPA: hypothetical protein VFT72_13645 [Opitutaceae bacterium]|nr:hypothetical protein [Opitutaceae bacterium]
MKLHHPVLALLLSFTAPAAFAQNSTPAAPATQNPAPAATTPAPAKAAPAGNRILPAPDRTTPIGGTITGTLDASTAVSTIQIQELDKRERLLNEINERVNSAEQQLNALKAKTTNLDENDKKAVDSAWNDYNAAKQRLQAAIQTARQADEKTWDRARAALAAEYGFYAAAVGSVEVATPN